VGAPACSESLEELSIAPKLELGFALPLTSRNTGERGKIKRNL